MSMGVCPKFYNVALDFGYDDCRTLGTSSTSVRNRKAYEYISMDNI